MDRREEIIALQNEIISQMTRKNLRNVAGDLWGTRSDAGATDPFSGLSVVPSLDSIRKMAEENTRSLDALTRELNGTPPSAQPEKAGEAPKTQTASAETKTDGKDDAPPKEDIEELKKELNSYIGLEHIKAEVNSLINYVTIMSKRREAGLPVPELSLHMVFSGNPGTGKTMIARLMARIYHSLGILSKGQLIETDRSGLVAGYVGQTAIKTKEVLDKAAGGVLFIDEAYTLTNRGASDYGQEAVDTLLKGMEDMRDDLVVIVAGYIELMEQFVQSNPGLKSRFNRFMDFPDYTLDEMLGIFDMRCSKSGYALRDEAAREALKKRIAKDSRDVKGFGNARGVRNLFERALARQADRLAAQTEPLTAEDLTSLTAEDIEKA